MSGKTYERWSLPADLYRVLKKSSEEMFKPLLKNVMISTVLASKRSSPLHGSNAVLISIEVNSRILISRIIRFYRRQFILRLLVMSIIGFFLLRVAYKTVRAWNRHLTVLNTQTRETLLEPVTWEFPKSGIKFQSDQEVQELPLNPLQSELLESSTESERTTLIMMSHVHHNGLTELLQMYSNQSIGMHLVFAEIILLWNDPSNPFEHSWLPLTDDNTVDIVVYPQSQNSLANRWLVGRYHSFKTRSVMFIDDDIYATTDRIRCLLNVWNAHKDRVVSSGGYRTLQPDPWTPWDNRYIFDFRQKNGIFNYLLPGWGLTVSIQNLNKVSSVMVNYGLLDIIDGQQGHCDDVAMCLAFGVVFGENVPYFYGIDNFKLVTDESKRSEVEVPTDRSNLHFMGEVNNYKARKMVRNECTNMLLDRLRRQHIDYDPIYDHLIGVDTISCDQMSTTAKGTSMYCPATACWEKSVH